MPSAIARSIDSLHQRLQRLAARAALLSAIVSSVVMLGWGLGIPWLTGISSRYVTMKPFTAICFLPSSLSLGLVVNQASRTSTFRRISQVSAAFVILVGLATLIEFATGIDFRFENWLFQSALNASGIPHPGRVSVASAITFALLGVALITLDFETRRGSRPAQFLAFAVVLLALLHLLGYLYAVEDLYRTFRSNSMAIHTAFLFLLLGLGTLNARPDRGFAATFNGSGMGGRMARRVLPAAVLLIVLIGCLRIYGENLGLYGTGFGLAIFATLNIAMLCVLVGWAAYSLQASTEKLDAATLDLAITHARANQTDAQLAAIVCSSDDAIISKNLDGVITSWNASAARIFGYSTSEAIGKHMRMLFPEEHVSEEADILSRISKGESIEHFESARVRKDGSLLSASLSISPLRDSKGNIVGASTIARDVTEHHRIQRTIEQQEARLSAIIGAAMDAVITIDERQRITMFNPAAEIMFGCRASDAIDSPLDRFLPQRFRAEHAQHIRAFAQTRTTRRRMGRMGSISGLRSNGEEFPLEASISQAEVNGQRLLTVILRDITERKRADEQMRQQASLLDLAPVLVRDLHSRIVLWTRGAQSLYGYTNQDALGSISHQLLQTQYPLSISAIEQVLHRDGSWEGELSHLTKDRRRVQVTSHWILHYDAMGKPARVLEFNIDVTDLKRVQNSQLRSQKLEALGTLAGGVAHDFNNILLAINGNAKLARMDLPSDHPVQQNLSEIAKGGARAADLVRRILAFSRPTEQSLQPQSVQPVVEEALNLVRATLPASIQIDTSFAPGLPQVALDATQIHQVIVNLATNASHAIGAAPGTITVNLSARIISRDDRLLLPQLQEGRYVCLTIMDTGCGMDAATVDRIFDPFFTTKPVGQGTGLGLSVVHGIVTSYGGTVTVYSEPGKGTCFHLYFPALESSLPPLSAAAPAARPAQRGRQEQILYVDDEEGLVMLGTLLLQRLGYQVTGHVDAAAALDDFRLRPDHFAALVTDLSMPRMTGFDLARQVLALRPGFPILMTSGYVRPEDQKAAGDLGIRRIITKPSSLDQLGEALADAIRSREVPTAPSA